jgi:hypothetical protein
MFLISNFNNQQTYKKPIDIKMWKTVKRRKKKNNSEEKFRVSRVTTFGIKDFLFF